MLHCTDFRASCNYVGQCGILWESIIFLQSSFALSFANCLHNMFHNSSFLICFSRAAAIFSTNCKNGSFVPCTIFTYQGLGEAILMVFINALMPTLWHCSSTTGSQWACKSGFANMPAPIKASTPTPSLEFPGGRIKFSVAVFSAGCHQWLSNTPNWTS